MRTKVIFQLYKPRINAVAFERVKEVVPEATKGNVINVTLPEGDVRLEEIVTILRAANVDIYADPFRTRDPHSIAMKYQTIYDDEDLRDVHLIFITCDMYVDGGIDEETGLLCAELRGPLKRNVPFVKVGPSCPVETPSPIVCPARMCSPNASFFTAFRPC